MLNNSLSLYGTLAERNDVLGSAQRSIIFSQSRSERFNFRICMIAWPFFNYGKRDYTSLEWLLLDGETVAAVLSVKELGFLI